MPVVYRGFAYGTLRSVQLGGAASGLFLARQKFGLPAVPMDSAAVMLGLPKQLP